MSQLIDVGPGTSGSGTDYSSYMYTFVDLANPANFDGIITSFSVCFYGYTDQNWRCGGVVSAFYRDGSIFIPRSGGVSLNQDLGPPDYISHFHENTVVTTTGLHIPIRAGDYIGGPYQQPCKDNSGGSGLWYYDWNNHGPDYTFGFDGPHTYHEYDADARLYIYATGITVDTPRITVFTIG
jgi:hypothetical protein